MAGEGENLPILPLTLDRLMVLIQFRSTETKKKANISKTVVYVMYKNGECLSSR